MARFELARMPRVVGGEGSRSEAGAILAGLVPPGAAVLLVADPGLKATGLADDVATSLRNAGLGVTVFSEFTGDPTVAQVDAAAAVARRETVAAVVSLGGGSALDLGKAVAAIATADRSAVFYQLCEQPFPTRRLPSIVIPTTSGTGSEATRTSIVTRADKAKVWLWGDELKPDAVILDPETTASLPAHLTAWTGIDALVHALEAATNKNATAANNVAAHAAIGLAATHLERAVADGADKAARAAMQQAAMLGGAAIDNAGTAVGHMIGHALGSLKPIHHGRAVAIGMVATLAWNIMDDDGRFDAAARAMGLSGASDLPEAFASLCRRVGIKTAIADEFADINAERLAEQFARPENAAMRVSNRRTVSDADLKAFATTLLAQA